MAIKHGEHIVLAPGDRDVVLSPAQHAAIRNHLDDVAEQLKVVYTALEVIEAKHTIIKNTLWRAANINSEEV